MEFSYNFKDNLFDMYFEGNYLVCYKKSFIKNNNKKIRNLFYHYLIIFIVFLLLTSLVSILNIPTINILVYISLFILSFMLLISYISYIQYKKSSHKGVIYIDKKGIRDKSDKEIFYPWNKIELVGITNKTLIIVTDEPIMFLLKPNEDIINNIKKYKDIVVIRSN